MENKSITKKEKAIEIMKKMDIYKPYIKGFRENDKVCFFVCFAFRQTRQKILLHC